MCWRKYSGRSPIGEVPPNVLAKVRWGISVITQQYYERVLAKVQCTFANWRRSTECIGESTVDFRQWRKSYWRNFGTPYDRDVVGGLSPVQITCGVDVSAMVVFDVSNNEECLIKTA
ncbi:unnamed protein product, partial [Rotaria magnacalcarata]